MCRFSHIKIVPLHKYCTTEEISFGDAHRIKNFKHVWRNNVLFTEDHPPTSALVNLLTARSVDNPKKLGLCPGKMHCCFSDVKWILLSPLNLGGNGNPRDQNLKTSVNKTETTCVARESDMGKENVSVIWVTLPKFLRQRISLCFVH